MKSETANPDLVTRRQPRGDATRADIVLVAKRLFSDHGYHSTGLSDIQAATGLTKGAFYHHFRSKEELALAVLDSANCDYKEHLTADVLAEPTPGRQLTALLDRVIELNTRPEWATCRMVATLCAELTAGSDGRLHDAVQKMIAARLQMLAGLIQQGQASGEIDPAADALVWAQWINATFLGLVLSRKLGAVCAEPHQVIQQIKHALCTGRSAPPRAPRRPVSKSAHRKEH